MQLFTALLGQRAMNLNRTQFVHVSFTALLVVLFVMSPISNAQTSNLNQNGLNSASDGQFYRGYTEPFAKTKLSSSETAVLQSVNVEEGQSVAKDQVIGQLDNGVLQASLNAAKVRAEARGPLDAANIEYEQKRVRFEKMQELFSQGHASPEELKRAEADTKIAFANVATAREQINFYQSEMLQIQAQLEQRTIRSPIDGVVVELFKEPGEIVAINDPVIAEVVALDRLKSTFYIETETSQTLAEGDQLYVLVGSSSKKIPATIDYISPTTDSESNTVRVIVGIENAARKIRSGVRCLLATDVASVHQQRMANKDTNHEQTQHNVDR